MLTLTNYGILHTEVSVQHPEPCDERCFTVVGVTYVSPEGVPTHYVYVDRLGKNSYHGGDKNTITLDDDTISIIGNYITNNNIVPREGELSRFKIEGVDHDVFLVPLDVGTLYFAENHTISDIGGWNDPIWTPYFQRKWIETKTVWGRNVSEEKEETLMLRDVDYY